jgi:ATP-dependent Clp protease ATP-binding subunit ClpA
LKENCIGKNKEIDLFSKELSQESLKKKIAPTSVLFYGEKGRGRTFLSKKIAESARIFGAQVFEYNGIEFDDKRKVFGDRFETESLAQKVSMLPNSVVVIDDFDKVNHNLNSAFEQIFKEGKLIIGGDVVDFSNVVFILFTGATSDKKVGFGGKGESNPKIDSELKKRIPIQIELSPLEKEDLIKILEGRIEELQINLKEKMEFDKDILEAIVEESLKKEDKFSFIEEEINKKILPKFIECKQ